MNRRRTLSSRRYSSVPCFTVFENDTTLLISLPTSPTDETPKFFVPNWPSFTNTTQAESTHADLDLFHMETDQQLVVDANQDLLGRSLDEQAYILKIFDPITQTNNQAQPPPPPPPPIPITTTEEKKLINSPIKLRLKLSVCSEMRSFYELVQQIRNDYQSKEIDIDELFYCKRVQRLTSQHIEQNQLPVTILIYTNQSKDPIRLPKVSLQSTVSHILYQLLERISFDYDQSILKLRSCEEYLRHDDTLCDIEYVHKCLNALKPLQLILTDKPAIISNQKRKELLTFEHFCFVQYEKYIQINKQILKLSNKRQITNDQTRWYIPTESRWLEDFHQNLSPLIEQIQRCFNQFFQSKNSVDEQIQFIEELMSYMKTIQTLCSNIRSNAMLNQHRQLKTLKNDLLKPTENQISAQKINEILIETLYVLEKYIRSYCQAFLIPYKLEIIDQNNQPIDLAPILNQSSIDPCSVTNSLELFTIQIDSLFSLPSNIKNVRVLARLCYGNQTIAKEVTRSVSCIRNIYQQGVSEIRLNERLLFNEIYLCNLQHESLILFEIYASFIDENDSSLTSEVFDGESMYLIGWCSQSLFDSNDYLITGEYYFGIIEAKNVNRTGFYSLRNISDHDCSILTVSFFEKNFFWPQVQARHDRQAQNFTEINRTKQEDLVRLLDQQRLYLSDHSTMKLTECSTRQQIPTSTIKENLSVSDNEYTGDEANSLWSHRYFLIHKPYALPKLFQSRTVWDYPSLIDIYGLFNLTIHNRPIDEIEAFELLLPAFPDMYIRSHTYRLLISQLTINDLMIYLPQLLQILKFDYLFSTPLIEHLLKESIHNHHFAHKFYWYLQQLLLTEDIHFYRYFYLFLSLLYVIGENLRNEFENEYLLCLKLRQIGLEIKTTRSNRLTLLTDHLKTLNQQFFRSGQYSCRLPCQFSFQTNQIDISSCSIFSSLTLPMKLVFQPSDPFGEKFYSIYKIGDDLRQDQVVLQLLSCMDKIWQANDWNFRLSLFNVVQTYERCGFVEMVTESETLMEIEKPLGTIKGSFGQSALYDWLRLQNTNEREFQKAIENLTYSCAGYCVGTYVLGIGDRHNENIMVKKSGHLFHIDFGKYLGDTQKFGWFNRDRSPLIFTKQMLYAMSDGGTSNDAMHRFVDLCCNAFYTLRQNSSLLLLLLSHLCSSNVPNLNYDAVRYVNDRLALSLNYAESITHFTNLIVDSLNSTWVQWNGLIHKLAQTTSSNASLPVIASGPTLSFIPQTYTIHTEGKIHSAQIVNYEKRSQPSKHYLYKIQVERMTSTYHYRTYGEFYEFSERLTKQFPLMGFDLKFSQQTEDKILAQRRVSEINDFLVHLFRSSNEVIESDLVCTFFHLIQRDQQINDNLDDSHQELAARPSQDSSPKIRIELKHDQNTLFIMVRHATNLPSKNGNEPKPYCKCYLFPDKSKSTKRKGKCTNSRNPFFNDTFTYEMDLSEIQKRVLRVSVWNNVISVGNRILGEVDIVLSQIDWSKENARDYTLTTLDSSTFFSI